MTAESFDKALEGLKLRSPFHPFTVEQIGGNRFEIDHPGALVVRDGVAVFISPGAVPVLFDHESVTHRRRTAQEAKSHGAIARQGSVMQGVALLCLFLIASAVPTKIGKQSDY